MGPARLSPQDDLILQETRGEKGALTAASRPLGVVATLESPNSPHCLDWVSIPNTGERPAIYGPPSHPLDGQTVRGLGTTWLAACYPHPSRHCDRGTFHTMVTLPTWQWLSQLSAPSPGRRSRDEGTTCGGSPACSSWPLASWEHEDDTHTPFSSRLTWCLAWLQYGLWS